MSRPDDGGLSDRVRASLATPHAKRSIRQRMCWAETPMAELKERHGLRRARCRKRTTVLMEALGAAMAYNIKKLARRRPQQIQDPALARHHWTTPRYCLLLRATQTRRPAPLRHHHTATLARLRQQSRWKHLDAH